MKHATVEPDYRDPRTASRVFDELVADGTDRLVLCVKLGISENAPRMWKNGHVRRISARTARDLRRLDRRRKAK